MHKQTKIWLNRKGVNCHERETERSREEKKHKKRQDRRRQQVPPKCW
jgi:hypothetical protein